MRAIFTLLALAGAGQAAPPNVLLLLTDDQRHDLLGALGHPAVKTPNLDRLVRGGFIFRNAYCLGSGVPAVCMPSRNMLLSGKAYFRWKGAHAPAEGSLPVLLEAAGYETYHHGKSGNVAAIIQKKFQTNRSLADQKERTGGQPGKTVVDDAIAFLRKRKAEKPFFMYLAFEAPHDPRVAAREYLGQYRREKIPLPANYLPVHPFDNGEMLVRDERLEKWPRTEDAIRRHLHEYYATMTGLDHHIGRLLDEVKRLKLDGDTVIVFSSDNGLAVGSHGLMGKQSLYDAGMKVPLVVSGPGIPKGESAALVYLLDLHPTLCEIAGAKAPAGLDGRSLVEVIKGKKAAVRDSLFLSYRDVQRAVRDDRWKLIRYPKIGRTQLFDLKNDPHETRDVVKDHPKEAGRLLGVLRGWQKDMGDAAPLSVERPGDGKFTPPAE